MNRITRWTPFHLSTLPDQVNRLFESSVQGRGDGASLQPVEFHGNDCVLCLQSFAAPAFAARFGTHPNSFRLLRNASEATEIAMMTTAKTTAIAAPSWYSPLEMDVL